MPDREKVIKGLECIKTEDGCVWLPCPYGFYGESDCRASRIIHDAIVLLKEQENLESRHKILVEKFDDLLATIKEMDVVRCKDCKFAHITIDGEYCKYCDKEVDDDGFPIEKYYPSDWYCPLGERK